MTSTTNAYCAALGIRALRIADHARRTKDDHLHESKVTAYSRRLRSW